jgi:hypothetical protein
VTHFGVWGLAAALALGLAACGDAVVAPKISLEPGGGFKAEQQEGVKARLTLPERVSAEAALIQVELTLENVSGDVATVTVPRSCDVHDWVIRDAADKIVMTKGPIECVDQPATKGLEPGSALTELVSMYLMPRVLEPGKRYVVDYRFWGQPARAAFTTQR